MGGGGDVDLKLCGGQTINKKGLNKSVECGETHEELLAALTKSSAEKSHHGRGLFKMVFGVNEMAL